MNFWIILSFIQQTFIESQLCVKHYSGSEDTEK